VTSGSLRSEVLALLTRENPDGKPAFKRADIVDVLGLLFMAGNVDPTTLPPSIAAALGEFSLRIGYIVGDSAETIRTKVDTYFLQNPPNPVLMNELRTLLAEHLGQPVGESVQALRRAFIQG
jgi:hypothetical protein